MEPNILLIGRNSYTLDILCQELKKFDRKVFYANSEELIKSNLKSNSIDLISVGAGLSDEVTEQFINFIKNITPEIPIHLMKKIPGMTPYSQIDFTNEKAVMWKLLNFKKGSEIQ
ncbi:MAG: hypothetical protein ACWA45_00545 [Flavobacteriales bacterium]